MVLNAYDSTEWDLRIEPGAKIAAILAMGYHPQLVSHVPPNTKVAFTSFTGKAGYDCPKYEYSDDPLSKIIPLLRVEYGVGVKEFYRRETRACAMMDCGNEGQLPGAAEPSEAPAGEVKTSEPLVRG